MALQRRSRKFQIRLRPIFFAGLAWSLAFLMTFFSGLPVAALATERVVNDRFTGLAMSGYDPVAYFTDAKPVVGKPDYEKSFAKVVWRFRSAGNREEFSANPDIYQPRYGGYDPVGIGRGVALAGNPLVWAIVGERLYLFYNAQARAEFVVNPEGVIATADGRWDEVLQGLAD
jgi:hypothetical protein